MTARRELTERDRRLLVALADGVLDGRRRERAMALVRELPDGDRLIERQRRVRSALAASLPREPAIVPMPARTRSRWGVRVLAPAVALVAVLAALLLMIPRGDEPSIVTQAADLAKRPPTAPAPASTGAVLRMEVDGVRFPDWSEELGWRPIGARTATLGGRPARTVFYEHMGHRIGYTILSGPPARTPPGARVVHRDGLRIALLRDPSHGGHDIAVFERGGRTCVLAGHVERVSTLVRLAAWRGGGAVRA